MNPFIWIWGLALVGTSLADDDDNSDTSDAASSSTDSSDNSSTDSDASSSSPSSTSISINPVDPAGGFDILTPATTKSVYVKVGDYQTFSWNFTSLAVTPSAVNIELFCSQNSHTYTLAENRSVEDTMFVWNSSDTNLDDTHLLTAKYTLRVYNSTGNADDTPTAGYLAPLNFVFAVYKPENYDSWPNAGKYVNMATAHAPGIAGGFATLALACIAFYT